MTRSARQIRGRAIDVDGAKREALEGAGLVVVRTGAVQPLERLR